MFRDSNASKFEAVQRGRGLRLTRVRGVDKLSSRVHQESRCRARGLLLWKPGDTKASSYASNPDLITYFDSNGTQLEEIIALIVHELLHVKRSRIHLRNTSNRQFTGAGIIAPRDMTGNHYGSISTPAHVVYVESYWGRINLYRGFSP